MIIYSYSTPCPPLWWPPPQPWDKALADRVDLPLHPVVMILTLGDRIQSFVQISIWVYDHIFLFHTYPPLWWPPAQPEDKAAADRGELSLHPVVMILTHCGRIKVCWAKNFYVEANSKPSSNTIFFIRAQPGNLTFFHARGKLSFDFPFHYRAKPDQLKCFGLSHYYLDRMSQNWSEGVKIGKKGHSMTTSV